MSVSREPYGKARRHLARNDPVMRRVIERVGSCTLEPADPFVVLVRAIISQLISTSAAKTVFGRLETALGSKGVTPAAIVALQEEALRGCGLSRAKTVSIHQLANLVNTGKLDLLQCATLPDDGVAERLLQLRGIGPWTVHMFLIFGLGRLNVLPVGDMGVRSAVREHYELPELPTAAQMHELAAAWLPYCSVAAWYLWRSRGWVPQSK